MPPGSSDSADVAIIGGGFAGACTARVLAARGIRCVLIDRRATFPDLFRAEKIEPDQAALLRSLGLLSLRRPLAPPVGTIMDFATGGAGTVDTIEQYGISYADTVNSLREDLPELCDFRVDEVVAITADGKNPVVGLASGASIGCRLVVLAAGGSDALARSLGLTRTYRHDLISLTYGFDLEYAESRDPYIRGLNVQAPKNSVGIDYLTVFPIGSRRRANLFTQQRPKDPIVGSLKADFQGTLARVFPEAGDRLGPWSVTSKIQVVPTTYARMRGSRSVPGVVVIGEEYQSVSPTTGLGLSKVLTDVQVLCDSCVPYWLSGGVIDRRALRRFYGNSRKRAVDRKALGSWLYYRDTMSGRRVSVRERLRQQLLLRDWID